MGGKHLRKLRAERAKVQLKKKKLLPKGQNLTDTSFKAKKIVTIEQLKKIDESEPVSSWNLTLKDLITRLNHHNYMTRLNSLNGIKELTTNYPQILFGPSLRTIVSKILEMLFDVEHKIRVTAINLLNEIFSQLPSEFLIPFYDLLNVHVCCALTHREVKIQQDALKFIDVMVEHTPLAAEKNFSNLLQNFIRILSNYNYGNPAEVTLSKKYSSSLEKSRTEVLKRFCKLLNIAYSKAKRSSGEVMKGVEINNETMRFEIRKLDNSYTKIPDLSALFKVCSDSQNRILGEPSENLKTDASVIVPLLFNTWVELAPDPKSDEFTSECLLTHSTADLLQIILEIFLLLYQKILELENHFLENWFISTYSGNFFKTFMKNFPYLSAVSVSKVGQVLAVEGTQGKSSAYMTQNLILCYLCYKFRTKLNNVKLLAQVEKYVLDALHVKNPPDFQILTKIIEVIVDSQKHENLEKLINSIVKIHDVTSNSVYRHKIFAILTKLTFSDSHLAVKKIQSYSKWMSSLPQRLLDRNIPLHVVETILQVVSCDSGAHVLRGVEEIAALIFSDLPNIRVEEKSELDGQKLVANILYRCSDSVLEKVVKEQVLGSNTYPQPLKEYIVGLASFKLKDKWNVCANTC